MSSIRSSRGGKGGGAQVKGMTGAKASGGKSRTSALTPHSGSRLDPSHVLDQARMTREKKIESAARNAAKKPGASKTRPKKSK
ncbi:MAG: hypothetical protein IPK69_04735 [Phycisphaerales bacterium]|nr:MAG: hypothetical protein IPK69_04735 [Phycisphaerales bacterium]